MSVLAEIFAPLIPAIITGGLILGFRNCIDSIYFFNNGTQTLCDISQFWSGVDSFLWLIGEASSICCRSASAGLSQRKWARPKAWASSSA